MIQWSNILQGNKIFSCSCGAKHLIEEFKTAEEAVEVWNKLLKDFPKKSNDRQNIDLKINHKDKILLIDFSLVDSLEQIPENIWSSLLGHIKKLVLKETIVENDGVLSMMWGMKINKEDNK